MAEETNAVVEKEEDFGKTPKGVAARWLAEIKAYDKHFETWRQKSAKVVKRYRDEPLSDDVKLDGDRFVPQNFNIFWSNVEVLKPAVMTQVGKVVVRRRNRDRNPVANAASQILQRALQYEVSACDYEEPFKMGRDDHLMVARGTVWVRYQPIYGAPRKGDLNVKAAEDGSYLTEDDEPLDESLSSKVVIDQAAGTSYVPEEGPEYSPVIDEKVYIDHVSWSDFGHTPAPRWEEVTAVWRRVEMTREQLVERFGKDVGNKVRLTKNAPNIPEDSVAKFGDVFKRGEVYEVWDKTSRQVLWVSPGLEEPLEVKPDPLGLQNFFPAPRPFFGTMTTNTLVPVPDYLEYQAQATQLDILTQRIDRLTAAMKVAGAYDGSFKELESIIKGSENTLIPVDNWAMFAEKGGLEGAISFLPLKDVADALLNLVNIRNQVKQDLYEVSGLSDLVRGQGEASATATAERIKGRFVSLRLQDRQRNANKFVRNAIAIVGEIMAEHFDPMTLLEMSGWLDTAGARAMGEQALVVAQQALQLLKDDKLRTFQIEIETESTILEDIEVEKKNRIEFLQGVSAFMQQAVPAIQEFPAVAPLLGELLMFGVRAWHKGGELEEVFERALEDMRANGMQSQGANAEAQNMAAELKLEQQKITGEQQTSAAELQLKAQEATHKQKLEVMKFEAENAIKLRELDIKERELKIKEQELELKNREIVSRVLVEQDKLQDTREGRFEETGLRREEMAQDKELREKEIVAKSVESEDNRKFERESMMMDQGHEMEMRRLDGKTTPTLEDEVVNLSSGLEKLVGALIEATQAETQATRQLIKVMSAPRNLVRDDKTGRALRSEVDLSNVETEGNA